MMRNVRELIRRHIQSNAEKADFSTWYCSGRQILLGTSITFQAIVFSPAQSPACPIARASDAVARTTAAA